MLCEPIALVVRLSHLLVRLSHLLAEVETLGMSTVLISRSPTIPREEQSRTIDSRYRLAPSGTLLFAQLSVTVRVVGFS